MIKSKDLYKEIEAIEQVVESIKDNPVQKAELKAQVLHLKLLHNIRTNLTLVMKKMGIELVNPEDGEHGKRA